MRVSDPASFPPDGGAMGAAIRARDWSDTALGPPETWPPALRNTLTLMLACPRAMFLAWGPDLLCFYNDAYRPILGYRLETALGRPFREVWASIWDEIAPLVAATLEGQSQTLTDVMLDLSRDGSPEESWWSFTYSPAYDDAGAIAGLFCVTAETTDHVLGEATLRRSEDHFRSTVELNPQVPWTCDPQGNITSYSKRWLELTGQAPGEPDGAGWAKALHPDDVPHTLHAFKTSLAAGASVDVDYRIRVAATGAYRWMRARAYPRRNAQGAITRWYGVVEDIQDQKAAEAALRENEERLRLLVEISDQLRAADSPLSIKTTASATLGRHLGVGRAGYGHIVADGAVVSVERDWTDGRMGSLAGAARVLDAFGPRIAADLRQGRTLVVEDCRTDPRTADPRDLETWDGIGTRAMIVVPMLRGGGLAGLFYVHTARPRAWTRDEIRLTEDVAARTWSAFRQSEAEGALRALNATLEERVAERTAELEQTHEALRQAQKMEAVGQLTGGVAHDFNNLLTIIRSSVDFLRRPDLPEARKARYLDAVSDTVDRAAKLTSQLLAFARRQTLKPEVFDVGARMTQVADLLDTVTGARIRVVTQHPEQPCFIRADVSQFETALVNMAVNARDAMDGEGILTLTLTSGCRLPPIRGHGGSRESFAAIALTDTGIGIPVDQIGRIFEPFFTTKAVGKGTGLGLSQVFGFAKQSGGDVDVTSAPGQGATFTLYLPEVTAERPGPDTGTRRDLPSPLGRGQSVLVVEDNLEVGRFATQILEDFGYAPTWALNAEEALETLGPEGNGFSVVFSDVVMPGMGGIALAEELRRRLPGLPVVLASGYSHVLAQQGAHGFELLHKPYSAEQLGHILSRVTAGPASEPGTGIRP